MTNRQSTGLALAVSLALALLGVAGLAHHAQLHVALFHHALLLERPSALVLLASLPLLLVPLGRTLVAQSSARQRLSLVLRALGLLSGTLALARPALIDTRQAVAAVVLVDVSDSMGQAQLAAAHQLVDELRRQRPADDRLDVVTFAAHPHRLLLPERPDSALPPFTHPPSESNETDLEAAFDLALTLLPPGYLPRILLISDGNETRGDLLARLDNRATQLHIDLARFPQAAQDEVLVRAVNVPADARVGAAFDVSAEIYSSRAQTATVTLYRDGLVNPEHGAQQVALTAGANLVHWKSEVLQAGFSTFKATLSAPPHGTLADHFTANNSAEAAVAVRGRPRVLYVEGEPASSGYLAGVLRKESFDVDVVPGYGLPHAVRDLGRYDLVILSDVPQAQVGSDQMSALESWVADVGGGLIVAGGQNSFGSGGWVGSRLERLLPVTFDVDAKRDQPQLALALCIDRSGSMVADGKIELAKDAARATAELLAGEDFLAVIAFDAQATSVVRLQRAANRARIVDQIARLAPGGGTAILPALDEAFAELDPINAKIKHVIVLTDGDSPYEGIAERIDEMVRHHITVSAVGVGVGADRTLLTMIAERGQGRFYYTKDASNVPRIFTKETSEVARSALVEHAVGARVQKMAEVLEGIPFAEAPPLGGYVATKPKPAKEGAELLLTTDSGEPLLSRWRRGLGQTAVFTSDVKNRWAARWLGWPGYARLWAHLARSTMRQTLGQGTHYDLTVTVAPPHAHVAVDAISPDDRFVSGLDTTLEVIDPDHPAHPTATPMPETAPGRYLADVPLDRYGAYLLRAVHRSHEDGHIVGESLGTVSLPYPREYLALPPDDARLQAIADRSHGRSVDPQKPAAIFDARGETIPFERPLWPPLVWAAAVLLVLDVASRRARWPRFARSR